ncbi:2OG-Fe(II) oxygenase [Pseudomonas sp. UFMG81]|jgi:SM-20-related protein|uniref:2OG-Fe(II) oxygenase n=1 Tax=Pseudomonas sp. UFMG81 TaxID=2745936 RepID=UPI00188F1060|nr:2OG-Fe(II) oxygenase [Pseudomonas sp. UFMG81]
MELVFSERDICVVDDAATSDELKRINRQLSTACWRYGWPVNHAPHARPCWHSFIVGRKRPERQCAGDDLIHHEQWGFLADFWRRVKLAHMQTATLLGVYANGQTAGQDSPIHRDNKVDEQGLTVVLFCNEHWATSWGGELVFYDHRKENILKSVLPKPGRMVVFNGHVPHSARSPAATCDQLRMTLAFKTII